MRFFTLLLFATAAFASCPRVLSPDPPLQLTIRQPRRATPRITGGELSSSNFYPYLVALLNDRRQLCTGVLISPHWFLTAAHCEPTTTSKAVISASQVGIDGEKVTITSVFIHPRYAPELTRKRYDVAVVEIEEDARKLGAKFMTLNVGTGTPEEGSFVRTLGFGRIRSGGGFDPFPFALRQIDLPVADHRICRKNYAGLEEPTKVYNKFHFCAGYIKDGGCDACGGPVIQYAGKKPVLQGIVSTGAGCGYPGFPGLNIRISAISKWLASTPAMFKRHVGKIAQVRRDCPAGRYLAFVEGKLARCVRCPKEMVSEGGPRRLCDQCPPTTDRDTQDPSTCSCRAVRGSGLFEGACVVCQPGFYSRNGDNNCRACPKGSYSAESGSFRCKKCKAARKGATKCPEKMDKVE